MPCYVMYPTMYPTPPPTTSSIDDDVVLRLEEEDKDLDCLWSEDVNAACGWWRRSGMNVLLLIVGRAESRQVEVNAVIDDGRWTMDDGRYT